MLSEHWLFFIYLAILYLLFWYNFFLPYLLNKFIKLRVKLELKEWCRSFGSYFYIVPKLGEAVVFSKEILLPALTNVSPCWIADNNLILVHSHIEFDFVVKTTVQKLLFQRELAIVEHLMEFWVWFSSIHVYAVFIFRNLSFYRWRSGSFDCCQTFNFLLLLFSILGTLE